MTDDTTWVRPDGPLTLLRGARRSDGLRAWDAADAVLAERGPGLLVGDRWGALACALGGGLPSWSEHAAAPGDVAANLRRNRLAAPPVSSQLPQGPHARALVRIPRSEDRFAAWLAALATEMPPGAELCAAGMARHVPKRAAALVERHVGPVEHHRGHGKARLIVARRDGRRAEGPPVRRWTWPGTDWPMVSVPGVFGGAAADPGALVLLAHLPRLHGTVLDLGCGSGVLGLSVAHRSPGASVVFVDADRRAVDSAAATWAASGLPNAARFEHRDVLAGWDEPVDAVLCNPPFHEGGAQTAAIAARMFAAAARALKPSGELWVVGNRHLQHGRRLKRHFGRVRPVSRDPRFVVERAAEPKGLSAG